MPIFDRMSERKLATAGAFWGLRQTKPEALVEIGKGWWRKGLRWMS